MGKRIPYIKAVLPDFESVEIECSELYFQLPIGYFLPTGEVLREFRLLPFTGHHELRLGELEEQWNHLKQKGETLDYLFRVYGELLIDPKSPLETIEGYSLKEVAVKAGLNLRQLIGDFYVADILFILLSIRRSVFGDEVNLSSKCPCYKAKDVVNYCDINTIVFTCWRKDTPPVFSFPLRDRAILNGVEVEKFLLSPLKFKQLPRFSANVRQSEISYKHWFLNQCIEGFNEDLFWDLSCETQKDLELAADKVASFGPDEVLSDLECSYCGEKWDINLPYGQENGYEEFYAFLLSPPRSSDGKSVSESLMEQEIFLSFGNQAPFNGSPYKVRNLTTKERFFWIEKTSETYAKQIIETNLIAVLKLLLKWQYQPEQRSGKLKASIRQHRYEIRDVLNVSHSLKTYLSKIWLESYQEARRQAANETDLAIAAFPEQCPFTIENILNTDYLPYFLAEEKAIERIKDLDDPSQWITTIQEGDEINEQELEEWLKKRGYKV